MATVPNILEKLRRAGHVVPTDGWSVAPVKKGDPLYERGWRWQLMSVMSDPRPTIGGTGSAKQVSKKRVEVVELSSADLGEHVVPGQKVLEVRTVSRKENALRKFKSPPISIIETDTTGQEWDPRIGARLERRKRGKVA